MKLITENVQKYSDLNLTTTCSTVEILHQTNGNCICDTLQIVVNGKELTVSNTILTWKWFVSIHGKGKIVVFITNFELNCETHERTIVSRIPFHKSEMFKCRNLIIDEFYKNWIEEKLNKCTDQISFSDYVS